MFLLKLCKMMRSLQGMQSVQGVQCTGGGGQSISLPASYSTLSGTHAAVSALLCHGTEIQQKVCLYDKYTNVWGNVEFHKSKIKKVNRL